MDNLTQKARAFLAEKQCGSAIGPRNQWIQSWRELANMTEGIVEDSPIFHHILTSLEQCDRAFEQENWRGFSQAYQAIKNLVETKHGITSPDGQRKDRTQT